MSLRLSLLHHLLIIYNNCSLCLVMKVDLLHFYFWVRPNLIKKVQHTLLPHKCCKLKNVLQLFFLFCSFILGPTFGSLKEFGGESKLLHKKNFLFKFHFHMSQAMRSNLKTKNNKSYYNNKKCFMIFFKKMN